MGEKHVVVTERHRSDALNILLSVAMENAKSICIRFEDVAPFYQGLFEESERAVGILAFAFIESQIYDLFRQQLDPDVQGGIASIIGPHGILDSVGAQIRMLRALRWIRPETEQDLRLLARIRNRFAHAHSSLTFANSKIRGYFDSLTKHEEEFPGKHKYPDVLLEARHRYLVRSVLTLFHLYSDLTVMPSSLRADLGPTGAFAAGMDKFPTALQHALAHCMMVTEWIYMNAAAAKKPEISQSDS